MQWGLFKEARSLLILPPLHVAPTRWIYKPPVDLGKPGFLMARRFHGLVSFVGKIGVHCEGMEGVSVVLEFRAQN